MKIKQFSPIAGAFFLTVFLFVSSTVAGQSQDDESCRTDPIRCGDVSAVSARIALLYDVDPKIVESYVEAAVNLENHTGIAAPIVIAIAIHESSFKSELFLKAGNPFGIKASAPWNGPTYAKKNDSERADYRVYGSAEEAILDFSNFIKSRDWYADALACPMDDYRCVLDGLKKTDTEPGYSMNPDWDEAVYAIIEKVKLQTLVTR